MGSSIDTCGGSHDPQACCVAEKEGNTSLQRRAKLQFEATPCEATLLSPLAGGVQVHPVGARFEKRYDPEPTMLGEGAHAKVRRCRLKRAGPLRACKTFAKDRVDRAEVSRHVQHLASLQAGSGQAHIMRLFEVFEDRQAIHLVLELCMGGDLYDRLGLLGLFSESEAAQLFEQMLTAVAHIHAHGLVHRDLKLESWLLTDASKLDLRLGAFNWCVPVAPGQSTYGKVGSPYYIAPEMLEGSYNHQVDLWSLGVVLFMLLSGNPPFEGQDQEDILDAIRAANLSFDARCWVAVSTEARDLVTQLLTISPTQRPSAAEALNASWLFAETADEGI